MKQAAAVLLLMVLSLFTLPAQAQLTGFNKPADAAQKTQADFREELSRATLAVYAGKQTCAYVAVPTMFGPLPVWQCGFESHFTCTATVVGVDDQRDYIGLTAGHCFDYDQMDKGYSYYVSEGVDEKPVLRQIRLLKFENNEQYDYATFEFSSSREYPIITVAGGPGTPITDSAVPALGTRVLNVNFSYGVVKEVTEGVVVSKQISEQEAVGASGLHRRYLIQMPFGPGASGSAIVNEQTHQVVALVEAMFPQTQMAAVVIPTGKNFADFLEDQSIGMKPQPEPKKTAGQAGPGADTSMLSRIQALYHYFFDKNKKKK